MRLVDNALVCLTIDNKRLWNLDSGGYGAGDKQEKGNSEHADMNVS